MLRRILGTTRMPRKKIIKADPIPETEKESVVIESQEIKYSSPRTYNPLLVVALLIVTFLLGMAVMRVQQLEKPSSATAPTAQNNQPQNNQPQGAAAGQRVTNLSVGHYAPKGDKNAKVKIVAFEDDRCPFCKSFMTDTETQIIKDYVDTGKAVFYFRDYAFLGAASTLAANANGCANEQGKFWDFIAYMYQNQPSESDTSMFTNENLTTVAGQLGMSTDQFSSCMTSNKYAQQAAQDLADGQKAGVSGTPTIFINGLPIVGAQPYSAFQTLIDQELKK